MGIDGDGIYYYSKKAHILSKNEKDPRKNYIAKISVVNLQKLFKNLKKSNLLDDSKNDSNIKITLNLEHDKIFISKKD